MTLHSIATIAATLSLLIGAIFMLIASYGLVKLHDPMTRLHAPTKAGTVGVGSLLLASMIHSFLRGDGSVHELLIMAFLFVTAPISANFIAKVHLHNRSCMPPPKPTEDVKWSTFDVPEIDRETSVNEER